MCCFFSLSRDKLFGTGSIRPDLADIAKIRYGTNLTGTPIVVNTQCKEWEYQFHGKFSETAQ